MTDLFFTVSQQFGGGEFKSKLTLDCKYNFLFVVGGYIALIIILGIKMIFQDKALTILPIAVGVIYIHIFGKVIFDLVDVMNPISHIIVPATHRENISILTHCPTFVFLKILFDAC